MSSRDRVSREEGGRKPESGQPFPNSCECKRSPKVSQPPRAMLRVFVQLHLYMYNTFAYVYFPSIVAQAHVFLYTVVCHSQALAKYARSFVSDLLF